jgi:hypothetical protein
LIQSSGGPSYTKNKNSSGKSELSTAEIEKKAPAQVEASPTVPLHGAFFVECQRRQN